MKELTKKGSVNLENAALLNLVLKNFLSVAVGFVAARACISGEIAPFGLSVAAAAFKGATSAAALGAALGYFIPVNGAGGFKYIAALAALCAVKYMLSTFKGLANNKIINCLAAFLVCALTNVIVQNNTVQSIVLGISEGILAAAGAYFFAEAFEYFLSDIKTVYPLRLCSIIIAVNLIFLGLYDIQFFEISLGRVAAGCFCLLCARLGGAKTGAVCAISAALGITLYNLEFSSFALCFCVAGLISGMFSKSGKIICCLAYILTFFLTSLLFGQNSLTLILFTEAAFSGAVFLVLPRSVSAKLSTLLSHTAIKPSQKSKCDAFSLRLDFAAKALKEVSNTVDTVAGELSKINCPDFDDIVNGVKQKVCTGCENQGRCWDTFSDKTYQTLATMIENITANCNGSISPNSFKAKCPNHEQFEASLKSDYSAFLELLNKESNLEQVREVVSDQFEGVSDMLTSLADEFKNHEQSDFQLAERVANELKGIGILVNQCGCRTDKYGRMTVEIIASGKRQEVFNRMHILRVTEAVCERDFETPSILKTNSEVLITLSEKAVYTVDIGVTQINNNGADISGDSYSCFYDGLGHHIALLSDGMGSGGRAAVDGAMATNILTKLLKAGFGWDCSLKILNSSMLFKSTDESLATVDGVCIDLFTGNAELFKSGAAPTVIKRAGRTAVAQSTSLPIGILRNVGFDKASVKLGDKDICVMLSDGAVADGTDWICAVLEDSSINLGAKDLSDVLAAAAKRRRQDNRSDDITVIVTVIHKSAY